MNQIVAAEYVENIQRLALGIEPIDFVRESDLWHPVRVDIERGLPHRAKGVHAPYCRPQIPGLAPDRLCRHGSGRFSLLYYEGISSQIDIRFYDHYRYYVPRRLRVPLQSIETVLDIEANEDRDYLIGRVRRPVLFPGAAYDIGNTITGLRGRVMRDGEPMRWSIVEARLPVSDTLVGRARGDDRGEFLLLLAPTAAPEGDLDASGLIEVEVAIAGPETVPTPDSPDVPAQDLYWDLPLEELPLPGDPDPISPGIDLPTGYVMAPSAERSVQFQLGRIMTGREVDDFVFTLP